MASKEQLERLNKINELVEVIASIDRKFFRYVDRETKQERLGRFEFQGKKLFWINEYNQIRIYPYGFKTVRFSHGGTLWALVKEFREWIITGEYSNGNNGYGGLYCTHWGYTEEGMEVVREKGREIGYIKTE